MKTKPLARGFTLIELLVVISIIAMLAAGAYAGYGAMMPGIKAKNTAQKMSNIGKWLLAYSNEHGGSFPEGESANASLRQLFVGDKYGADENQFITIESDAYTKNFNSGKGPDGDKGTAPEYKQALEPGENPFVYVMGLSNSDESRLPIMANGFAGSPGVWTDNKTQKGGVFQGKYAVVLRLGGSAQAHEIGKDTDFMVKEKKGGSPMNIFDQAFFGMDVTIQNPE